MRTHFSVVVVFWTLVLLGSTSCSSCGSEHTEHLATAKQQAESFMVSDAQWLASRNLSIRVDDYRMSVVWKMRQRALPEEQLQEHASVQHYTLYERSLPFLPDRRVSNDMFRRDIERAADDLAADVMNSPYLSRAILDVKCPACECAAQENKRTARQRNRELVRRPPQSAEADSARIHDDPL